MQRSRTPLFYIKRFTGLLLLLLTAAVFLFSGISKLYAFDGFAWNIMDAGISNMAAAGIIARFFIGAELMLGLFLLAHVFLRSFTYPAVITLLVFFNLYLLLLIVRQGNEGDCGCFGEALAMTPMEAIIKNLALTVVAVLLVFFYSVRPYKYSGIVAVAIGLSAMATPFFIIPPGSGDKPAVVSEAINLSPLYRSLNPQNHPPKTELRDGKHIIGFMSLSCSHCKKAAFMFQVIHRQYPEIPLFMVLNGPEELRREFFEESHAQEVPHVLFHGPEEFVSMAGTSVPSIYWVNDSRVERKSTIFQLDPKYMLEWLSE